MGHQPYHPQSTVRKVTGHMVQVGEAVELQSAINRKAEMEAALEQMRREKIEAAQAEADRIIGQARQEAQALMRLAEQRAKEMIADGHARREATLQQAYDEGEKAGFEKGYGDGHQRAEEETLHLLASAQTVMDSAYMAQTKVLKSIKQQATQVIETIANTVLHHTVTQSPEALLAMVDGAIEQLNLTGKMKVVVSAETLEAIKSYSAASAEALAQVSRLALETDPLLEPGEVYVISEGGNFILSPSHQVAALVSPVAKHLDLPKLTADDLNAGLDGLPPTPQQRQEAKQLADEEARLLAEAVLDSELDAESAFKTPLDEERADG